MAARTFMVDGDLCVDEREAKFLPDGVMADAFWPIALQHLRPERAGQPFSYTRTTYFDTPDLAYYRSEGLRLRVREYAAAGPADPLTLVAGCCYLELKQSAHGRRTKTRLALRPDQVAAELAASYDAPLAPCVATWYRRRALIDETRSLRVTIDDRILLCRPRPLGSAFTSLGSDDVLAEGPPFVIEYKAWTAPPLWLVRALDGLTEAVGFSKFMLGMDALASGQVRCAAGAR